MIELIQHIPAFVEGATRHRTEIAGAADLKSVDWVEQWKADPGFRRFSVSRNSDYKRILLMAEFENASFYVVGFLSHDLPELPAWKSPTAH